MGEEIKMTTPVPVKHTPTGNDKEDMKMCFWLGSVWENKEAPQPIGKDAATTEIKQGKGMKVWKLVNSRKYFVVMIHETW